MAQRRHLGKKGAVMGCAAFRFTFSGAVSVNGASAICWDAIQFPSRVRYIRCRLILATVMTGLVVFSPPQTRGEELRVAGFRPFL
jgi:hypothetical protein